MATVDLFSLWINDRIISGVNSFCSVYKSNICHLHTLENCLCEIKCRMLHKCSIPLAHAHPTMHCTPLVSLIEHSSFYYSIYVHDIMSILGVQFRLDLLTDFWSNPFSQIPWQMVEMRKFGKGCCCGLIPYGKQGNGWVNTSSKH